VFLPVGLLLAAAVTGVAATPTWAGDRNHVREHMELVRRAARIRQAIERLRHEHDHARAAAARSNAPPAAARALARQAERDGRNRHWRGDLPSHAARALWQIYRTQRVSGRGDAGDNVALPPPTAAPVAPAAPAAQTPSSGQQAGSAQPPAPPSSDTPASPDAPARLGGPTPPAQAVQPSQARSVVQDDRSRTSRTGAFATDYIIPAGTYRQDQLVADNVRAAVFARLPAGSKVSDLAVSGLKLVTLPTGVDARSVLAELRAEFREENLGLNFFYAPKPYQRAADAARPEASRPAADSTGCRGAGCYGRKAIGWSDHLAACARGVRIGIVDTGFDRNHPTFAARAERLKVVMGSEHGGRKALEWHGTGVISLLAGAPASSTPGLVPDAEFFIADAFFTNSSGAPETDTAHLLEALGRLNAPDVAVQIVNMSLVGPKDALVYRRIVEMTRRGVVFVAAAGNNGPGAPPGYPAAYKEVIAVTAIDEHGVSYDSASHGDYIDVAAPGVRVRAALPGGREGLVTGTSFAAPFVTAIAAVSLRGSPLDPRQAREALDPKSVMLRRFRIEPIGGVGPQERDVVYGLGMVKAPQTCGSEAWAANVERMPAHAPARPQPAIRAEPVGGAWPVEVMRAAAGG